MLTYKGPEIEEKLTPVGLRADFHRVGKCARKVRTTKNSR